MLRKIIACGVLAALLCAGAARAQDAAPAVAEEPAAEAVIAADDPFTVTNIVIDKTAQNAVEARAQAMMAARREAFRKLAEAHMPPDMFAMFTMPQDAVIMSLVRDFEITREQIAATRYVGVFTVTFDKGVRAYVPVGGGLLAGADAAPAPVPRALLVLPYYETETGGMLLWEENNPWMEAWQSAPPAAPGWVFAVPLGDIGDMAAGDPAAAWNGDYAALEKLRQDYNVAGVVLAVANTAGRSLTIDLYLYRDGRLERYSALAPYTAAGGEQDSLRRGVRAVVEALQAPPPLPLPGGDAPRDGGEGAPAPQAAAATRIDAEMRFSGFAEWMEAQKRLAAVDPPVTLSIRSLSSTAAAFTLSFDGGMEQLGDALAAQGLALGAPVVEVGEASRRAVRELHLVR